MKENSLHRKVKETVLLLFLINGITYVNGAEFVNNKNMDGIKRSLPFSEKDGQNKDLMASWIPSYLSKDIKIFMKACRNDDDCKEGSKCVKLPYPICVRKCNVNEDCKLPMTCKKKEKYCFGCLSDTHCEDNEVCNWKTYGCQCANGLSGSDCEVEEWCKDNGKFKDCRGSNGTCEYIKSERAINCTCTYGKKLHPDENRCKETCTNAADCKNGGMCEEKGGYKFCSCKPGVIGDKCEIVFDCTTKGKFKDCESSGGKCYFKDDKAICECSKYQKLNEKKFICEICICRGGECVIEDGKKVCKCPPGYGNFTDTSCKVCDCGPDVNCIWEARFGGGKICLCKPGNSTKKGKCVACECGPDSNCVWISEGWLEPDKKVCHCKVGYHEVDGKCVDKQDLLKL